MRIVLDTNRYTDLARDVPEVRLIVATAEEINIPFVVLAELAVGFQRGTRRSANEVTLRRFLSDPDVKTLYPDERTVQVYSDLACELLANGTPIPIHDVWIAALTLQHGLTLYARDKHIDHLPQVPRV